MKEGGELLRHIRTLLQDNPIVLKEAGQEHSLEWDAPVFLAALHIVLNSHTSTETGYSPNELVFGPESAKNYSFLTPGTDFNATKFLKELGASLGSANRTYSTQRFPLLSFALKFIVNHYNKGVLVKL